MAAASRFSHLLVHPLPLHYFASHILWNDLPGAILPCGTGLGPVDWNRLLHTRLDSIGRLPPRSIHRLLLLPFRDQEDIDWIDGAG